MNLLSSEERHQLTNNLAGYWQVNDKKLSCRLIFTDFVAAFAFMSTLAIEAEKMNHHPTWTNTYNSLDIELSTHDAGGLTALDFKLAGIIDERYSKLT